MKNSHLTRTRRARLTPRKKPGQLRSSQTVEAILEGAAHILEGRGLDGYTTNEIAARAGVSIGSLYQYFPTKDAITLALVQRESTALVDEINAALCLEDPKRALREMIEAAVRNQLRRPKLARLLDFEEARLATSMPPSTNAAAARAGIMAFLQRCYGLPASETRTATLDVMEIIRALTDAAGTREHVDATLLADAIEGALRGYLGVRCGTV
ncbi:TetR/AcrR family transcriptional regulator [Bradyrhizobium sp. OAE829]|uniref:TetR/AcrR family transcriptional regulator n=1 Tax=Bradyrhizobium sp. OAE829 TaxID=2663807 RepID=UPI0019E5CD90